MTPYRLFEEGRWRLLLLFALVTPCLFGTASGIAAVLVAMLFLPALAAPGALGIAVRQPAVAMFSVGFLTLLALFAITARAPGDLIYVFNFLSLAMAAGVYLVARQRAGARTVLVLSFLCLAGAAVAVAVGLYDVHVGEIRRARGLFSNPNPFARVALLLGFCALTGILVSSDPRRWVLLLGPVLGVWALLLAGSRGTFVALPAMVLLFAAMLLVVAHRRRIMVMALLVIAAMAGAAVLVAPSVLDLDALGRLGGTGDVVREVMTVGASSDRATAQRLELYAAGLAAFQAAPILGHGWARVIEVVVEMSGDTTLARFDSLLNDFLNFAVAGGVVGILVLIGLLLAPLLGALGGREGDRLWQARLYAGLLLSSAYLIYGLTDSVIGNDLPTNLYPLVTALLLGACREPRPAA